MRPYADLRFEMTCVIRALESDEVDLQASRSAFRFDPEPEMRTVMLNVMELEYLRVWSDGGDMVVREDLEALEVVGESCCIGTCTGSLSEPAECFWLSSMLAT